MLLLHHPAVSKMEETVRFGRTVVGKTTPRFRLGAISHSATSPLELVEARGSAPRSRALQARAIT